MRKRIAKELPKLAADLSKTLQKYEDEFGRPFLVHGEPYLDELEFQEVKVPPPRSKTPNGLPPRSKTPAPASVAKPATINTSRPVQPPRPKSAIGNASLLRSTAKAPTATPQVMPRAAPPAPSAQPPSRIPQSPSKIPGRVPLGNLQQSPERRRPAPQTTAQSCEQSQHAQHNFAQSARTMGPPRAPPPKMRNLFEPPGDQTIASLTSYSASERPASVQSSSNNSDSSSKFVRPISPEDVYDDRERMSYMSASVINRDHHYQQHSTNFHASIQIQPNPARPASRQTSNTSSNLTTGTTASGSENWETYSDASELEPDRDGYYIKGAGKRPGAPYGHMAPPPKMRSHERAIQMGDKAVRINGSDAAWTECSETF